MLSFPMNAPNATPAAPKAGNTAHITCTALTASSAQPPHMRRMNMRIGHLLCWQCACRNKKRRPLRTRASFQPFINPITIPPTKVLRWCRTCEQSSSHHILPALKLGITAWSAVLGWHRLENPGILPARPARCTRPWVTLEYHRSFHRQTGQPQSRSINNFHQPWHAWHYEGSLSRPWQFAPHWRPRSAPERQITRIHCNQR